MARKNYYVCPVCKSKNEDTKKYCDSCGTWLLSENFPATKYNRPKSSGVLRIVSKVIGYTVLGIVLVLGVLIYIGGRIDSQPSGTTVVNQESEEEYKASTQAIDYEGLARNPDSLKGQRVKLQGKVFVVSEQGNSVGVHMHMSQVEFGWGDSVYIYYTRQSGEDRILDGDMITVWGEVHGLQGFKTVLGADISMPTVNAKYIVIE